MNLNVIQPKNETEDLLLSITKNCETLFHQTHTRPQETLEFVLTQPNRTISFKPSINFGPDFNWMIRLSCLEVYNSSFNKTEQNTKFELYPDTFHKLSFEELRDELEEIFAISDITTSHLQQEKRGSPIIQAEKELGLEKSSTDGYTI